MALASATSTATTPPVLRVEGNGINVIPENERHGTPRSLFWPWAASSISLLNISIAALLSAFGMSFIPTAVAGVFGIVLSFFVVGLVSLAGTRASAPTMVISRTAFGVRGNAVPTLVSYLVLVGWEIVIVVTTVLAVNTVFARLGWPSGGAVEVVVFVVAVGVVMLAGVFGFRLVTRFQSVVTVVSIAMIIAFIALTIGNVNWTSLGRIDRVTVAGFIGASVIAAAAFGLSWSNSGADYSRYLPRSSSGKAIVGWTTFGGSLMPSVLVIYGLMLVTSEPGLAGQLATNPIGALVSLLPTSALILLLFLLALSLAEMVGGAMDLYSSGLTLLTLGLKVPRAVAAGLDGLLMTLGSLYLVWFAGSFFGPFESFLIFLGAPLAAWAGAFIADATLRRQDYSSVDMFDARGRYGSVGWPALGSMIAGTFVGWGLVTSSTSATILAWQGFIFTLLGVAEQSTWRASDIGVIVALLMGFAGTWAFGRARIRRQEFRG